jgi:hypothetical protein
VSDVAQIYNALQTLARRQGRATSELQTLYVLERFLERLTRTRCRDNLVLKGGVVFDFEDARVAPAGDADEYSGLRTRLTAHRHTAKLFMHVEVSPGDPIWSSPVTRKPSPLRRNPRPNIGSELKVKLIFKTWASV